MMEQYRELEVRFFCNYLPVCQYQFQISHLVCHAVHHILWNYVCLYLVLLCLVHAYINAWSKSSFWTASAWCVSGFGIAFSGNVLWCSCIMDEPTFLSSSSQTQCSNNIVVSSDNASQLGDRCPLPHKEANRQC